MASHPYLKKVRQLFSRLLCSFGVDPSLSMMIITFWMFVQDNSSLDLFECTNEFNHHDIVGMITFVKKYLHVLVRLESSALNTSSLSHKEVVDGIDFYLNNVCFEAVGDILDDFEIQELIYQYAQDHDESLREEIQRRMGTVTNSAESSSQAHNTQGQGTSAHNLESIREEENFSSPTYHLVETFDALSITKIEDELKHQQDIIPKEQRTLLVIFSDGYPLTGDELNDFFSRYGMVQEIVIKEPPLRLYPVCALITYHSPYPLLIVLNEERRVHLIINRKDVWVQRYVEDEVPTSP
ncbi:hypothetical protein HU200_028947 [Digitaria exilis]|uniref:Uncharacterized protein n=1 Tax=Digitaria exilis TaxID=1010633 RepID=A0A835BV30_9POAL|nr:hypothetical protein HU200_028947 [Digitaria exilis]